MTVEEICKILEAHQKHLTGVAGGAYANLQGADLQGADLYGANLSGAVLQGADLYGANLDGANLPDFQICPEEGAFIGWKKALSNSNSRVLLKLSVFSGPELRCTNTLVGRKCRAEKVRVDGIFDLQGSPTSDTKAFSLRDTAFTYTVNEISSVDDFDGDVRVECTSGIHFFMTRKEAEEYE